MEKSRNKPNLPEENPKLRTTGPSRLPNVCPASTLSPTCAPNTIRGLPDLPGRVTCPNCGELYSHAVQKKDDKGEISYHCPHCGKEVKKDDPIVPV